MAPFLFLQFLVQMSPPREAFSGRPILKLSALHALCPLPRLTVSLSHQHLVAYWYLSCFHFSFLSDSIHHVAEALLPLYHPQQLLCGAED